MFNFNKKKPEVIKPEVMDPKVLDKKIIDSHGQKKYAELRGFELDVEKFSNSVFKCTLFKSGLKAQFNSYICLSENILINEMDALDERIEQAKDFIKVQDDALAYKAWFSGDNE